MSSAAVPVYVSEIDLAGLGLTPSHIADSIEDALRAQAVGSLWTVPKSALMPGDGRYFMTTLSVGDGPGLSVVKVAMVSPRNPERGLPGIEAAILVLDAETGEMRATMGGKWITEVRTAGLSCGDGAAVGEPGVACDCICWVRSAGTQSS